MCKKCSGVNGVMDGVNLQQIGLIGGGFVAGKMANIPLKKIPFIENLLSGDKAKFVRLGIAGSKILTGLYAQTVNNELVQDAGKGFGAAGILEVIGEFMPQLEITGVGMFEDAELLGNVIDIDLDSLTGGFDQDLESYQEVAGHALDEVLEEDQMLAGEYMYDELAY